MNIKNLIIKLWLWGERIELKVRLLETLVSSKA